MNLGFDAKRAFHNDTGLGHYSRTLLRSLAAFYPEHHYYLFNPKKNSQFELNGNNFHEINPSSLLNKTFSSYWRSSGVKKDLRRLNIELYHGLSHEIPVGIPSTGIPSVVTMHDLIHERFPHQYTALDNRIYGRKFRYACKYANRVIAISEQTKKDIISFYGIPGEKIDVCYQSCNPAFGVPIPKEKLEDARTIYNLPSRFFLYVGSLIERKNLMNVCRALSLLAADIPLVVIGNGKGYKQKVKELVRQKGLEDRVIFLSESPAAQRKEFRIASDFPAIYQLATAMIYPSSFEGFGIPVLEGLWSGLPVITSNVSSLPEAGGDAAYYVDPSDPAAIAEGMSKILSDHNLVETMKEKGWQHAQKFSTEKCAAAVMAVYKKILNKE